MAKYVVEERLEQLNHVAGLCTVPDMHPFVEAVQEFAAAVKSELDELRAEVRRTGDPRNWERWK